MKTYKDPLKIKAELLQRINEVFGFNFDSFIDLKWGALLKSTNEEIFSDFCEEFMSNLPPGLSYLWDDISTYKNLPTSFLIKFCNKLNWYYISVYVDLKKFTPDVCRELQGYIKWRDLLKRHGANFKFIQDRLDYIPWDDIIYFSWVTLPEELIERRIFPILSIGAQKALIVQTRYPKAFREKLKRKICV